MQQLPTFIKGVSFSNFEKRSFIVSKIGFCNGKPHLTWRVGEWKEKEKEFYQKASRLEGQNSFESIAQSCIMKVFLRVFERSAATKKPKYVWLTPERIAAYYAQSMCYVVITWIKSGMTISSKELAEIYNYMIKRSMTDILTEL